jgi:hypothetical protein
LRCLSAAELRQRYDPKRMTKLKIDPSSPQDDRALSSLLDSFNELKVFAAKAAAAGDGLLVHLG